MTMTWEQEYAIKKAKRAEFIEKHGLSQPAPFFGPRKPFQITSGAVRATDPCYSMDTWCAGSLANVLNGNWLGWSRNVADDWSWEYRIDRLVKADFSPSDEVKSYEEIARNLVEMARKELQTPSEEGSADSSETASLEGVLTSKQSFLKVGKEYIENNLPQNPMSRLAVATLTLKVASDNYSTEEIVRQFVEDLRRGDEWGGEENLHEVFKSLQDKVCGWRQSMLTVIHEDYKDDPRFSDENILETVFKQAEPSEIHVGVDSGQAGIFDLEIFKTYAASENHGEDTPEHERFYEVCCDICCADSDFRRKKSGNTDEIVICADVVTVDGQSFGYNSSSGEGDGGYALRYIEDENGKVIMMNIMFMTPEEYYMEDEDE